MNYKLGQNNYSNYLIVSQSLESTYSVNEAEAGSAGEDDSGQCVGWMWTNNIPSLLVIIQL